MTILVATDLSSRSDRAIDRALLVAREHAETLTVLHAIDDDLPVAATKERRHAAERAFEDMAGTLPEDLRDLVRFEIVEGTPHAAILEKAEALDATLIVLGTHGHRGALDRFLETTAERVIREGQRPVLMVTGAAARPYRHACVGVDFSPSGVNAARVAIERFPTCAQHLVHAYHVPFGGFLRGEESERHYKEEHTRRMQDLVQSEIEPICRTDDGTCPALNVTVKAGTILDVLHDAIAAVEAELLVVGTHGRTGVARAIIGSVAAELLADPPCDVLVAQA